MDVFLALDQIDTDNLISDEDEAQLEKLAQQTNREKRQQKRLRDCGKWANWYDPHTGKRSGFTFRCELFRMCATCLAHRADEEYKWMKDAALHQRLRVVRLPQDKATKALRGVDKTEYVRYPQQDYDLIIVNEELGIPGEDIDLGWVLEQDWEEIVCTPEGRNKSGTLHVPKSDEQPEEFSIIHTKQFITDAPRRETIRAMDSVITETNHFDPKNPEDVVDALNERIAMVTKKLKDAGFLVHVYTKQLKLVHSRISWNEEISVNKRIKTENPTREALPPPDTA